MLAVVMEQQGDSILFKPLRIGGLEVAGRVFKAATTETCASEEGFVTDDILSFYEPFAYAGTPLVITGSLYVNLQGKTFPRAGGIDADDKIPGLQSLTDSVHRYGSKIFAQLNHCGRQVFPKDVGLESAVSASAVREKVMGTKPRPMTREEIRETVKDFASAAGRAQESGFDGVEILAGVGYLLSAFLTPYTNRRTDEYGGSLSNRMRFLLEVLRAVRERVGPEFPVIAKLNGTDGLPWRGGLKTPELLKVGIALESEGLDGVEITASHYETAMVAGQGQFDGVFRVMVEEGRMTRGLPGWRKRMLLLSSPVFERFAKRLWPPEEGFLLPYSRQFKAKLEIPVMSVGGFQTGEAMEEALATQQCDAVAVGRAMVADPLLYKHLREDSFGPVCDYCSGCVARVGHSPVACYNRELKAQQAAMLTAEGLPS